MLAVITKSPAETKKLAGKILRALVKSKTREQSLVLALRGELGSGKTTFVQGLAKSLGLDEKIQSPTFVLMRGYALPKKIKIFRHFLHIDAYRLTRAAEVKHFGFREMLKDKDALIAIEWAERVKKLIPKRAVWIHFGHKGQNVRRINLSGNAAPRKL